MITGYHCGSVGQVSNKFHWNITSGSYNYAIVWQAQSIRLSCSNETWLVVVVLYEEAKIWDLLWSVGCLLFIIIPMVTKLYITLIGIVISCVCVCVMWVHVVVYVSAYGNWLYSVPLCYSIDTLTASAFLTTWLIGSPLYTTRLTTTVVYDALLSTVKWRIFGKWKDNTENIPLCTTRLIFTDTNDISMSYFTYTLCTSLHNVFLL